MSYYAYFINETKKEVVSSKVLSDSFEDGKELLDYLSGCIGDTIRIEYSNSEWVEGYLSGENKDYKYIIYK